jgi:hypothetical protein
MIVGEVSHYAGQASGKKQSIRSHAKRFGVLLDRFLERALSAC